MVKAILESKLGKKIHKLIDKESKVLIKNSFWVFFANSYGAGLAFLRSILIARGLGAETLGAYAVIIAFVVTIQEIVKLNVALGVIQFGAKYIQEKRLDKVVSLLKGSVLTSLVFGGISVLIVGIISFFTYDYFFSIKGLHIIIILYAIVNSLSFIDNIGRCSLKIFYKFKINAIVQIVMDTFEFIMVAICIYLYPKNIEYFFYTAIITKFINSLICNIAIYIELKVELKGYLNSKISLLKNQYKELSNFVVGNSFSNTLKTFMNQGDVLLLNMFSSTAAVGVYTVSKKLAYSILTITDPLTTSSYPQLAHLSAQRKYNDLLVMLKKITKALIIPIIIFLFLAYIFRNDVTTKIYGSEYIHAGNPFFIHLLGAAQGALFFWSLPLIQSMGLTRIRIYGYIIALISQAIITFLLAPRIGASGAAIGLLVGNLITTLIFLYFSFQRIKNNIVADIN